VSGHWYSGGVNVSYLVRLWKSCFIFVVN
jgi:hypothetical protein